MSSAERPESSSKKRCDRPADDLEPLESLTSPSMSRPSDCKRVRAAADASSSASSSSSYQEHSLAELRQLFGCKADDALIRRVYFDQCDEDLQKSIAVLVAATGLHEDLVVEARPDSSSAEEKKDDDQAAPAQQQQPAFRLLEVSGDLFSCGASDSLCHCISADIAMGKGIATAFKARFGGVDELKKQNRRVGQTAVLRRGERYVYYLITKARYWNHPTYEDLQAALEDMKRHCLSHSVRRLCMPRIGCGLDGLLWPTVRQLIQRVFAGSALTITVYSRDDGR